MIFPLFHPAMPVDVEAQNIFVEPIFHRAVVND
jgi:hypothetical protein